MSPARAASLWVAAAGAAVVAANLRGADESLYLGVGCAIAGGWLAWARETSRRRRATELLAVLLLVLAGGEAAVRYENASAQREYNDSFVHFVDDPILRYELKPNTPCAESTTNALGMLDLPRSPDNPARALRIACLGDSVGGDCQLPRDNVCAQLAGRVSEVKGGAPVEALNFSVPGYNTLQEARALELKAAPFRPDAVVVLYVLNDPYPELAISHVMPGHFKFEHLLYGASRLLVSRAFAQSMDPFGGALIRLYDDPRAWDGVVVAGFDRISAFAAARKLPVVVAIFPLFADPPRADYRELYVKVAREAERHGFVAVDLSKAAFARVPVPSLLKPSRDLIHPNAHAHALAAAAIAHALVEAGL